MKIYVASSWRNDTQPEVVQSLQAERFEVYDFKNPEPGNNGFRWTEIDSEWKGWNPEELIIRLNHPVANMGFGRDWQAMNEADLFVLVMPCGRSAHLEAGWAIGMNKPTAILLSDGEPELMYKMATALRTSIEEIVNWAVAQRANITERQQNNPAIS